VKRIPLAFERLAPEEQKQRAAAFLDPVRTHRNVRDFSSEPVL